MASASRMVEIYCSPQHFQTIKDHPMLGPALRLARCVNSLRALMTAAVPSRAVPAAERVRQSQNILLLLGATLFEALEVLGQLGPDLGKLSSVREHLIPLRRDRELRHFKEHILRPIRQTVAFHFDADVLPRSFSVLRFATFVWSSETSPEERSTYYELADHSLIPAAFTDGDYQEFLANYARYLNDTAVHCQHFCRAADAVLSEVASVLGFRRQEVSGEASEAPA